MNEVKDRVGFLREGLFAKYVVALVGLVVFVLAINGAMEVWISYRGIKSSLNDGMSEKAEATAKRIQQSLSDLERQISWVTRASATNHRAATLRSTAKTMRSLLNRCRRSTSSPASTARAANSSACPARPSRSAATRISPRDVRFTETVSRGTSFRAGLLPGRAAIHVDRAVACRRQRHRRRDRS